MTTKKQNKVLSFNMDTIDFLTQASFSCMRLTLPIPIILLIVEHV